MIRIARLIISRKKERFTIDASKQVEIPIHKFYGRQGKGGFGALAQFFGRTGNPFLRNYIVTFAKHVGADLM